MGDTKPDIKKQLQELYELMLQEGLESVEVQTKGTRIRLNRAHAGQSKSGQGKHPSHSPAASPAQDSTDVNQRHVTTPLAGVFYRAPSPTRPPFVKENDLVEQGQTLCIVEAMKVLNEIKADARCRIVKILAENSRSVTAGQALFTVEVVE